MKATEKQKQKEANIKWYSKNKSKKAIYTLKYQRAHKERVNELRNKYYHKVKSTDKFKNTRFIKKFNISLNDFNLLKKHQKNLCGICNRKETERVNGIIKTLCVDHSHKNGKVRGLLCNKCNKTLGLFDDNIKLLELAIKYLKKYE